MTYGVHPHTFTFGIDHCRLLQSSPLLSLFKVSCISATSGSTTGTECFGMVCRMVSNCSWISGTGWKHPHNCIFNLENKKKSQGASQIRQALKKGNRNHVSVAKNCYSDGVVWSVYRNGESTNPGSAIIPDVSSRAAPLQVALALSIMLVKCLRWRNKSPTNNAQAVTKDPSRDNLTTHDLWLQFPHLNHEKQWNVCVLPKALSLTADMCNSHVSAAVLTSLKQNLMQMHRFFKSVIAKSQTALDTDNNNHLLRSNADGHSCKTHWTDSENNDTKQPSGNKAVQLAILGPTTEFRDFWICLIIMFMC